MFKAEQDIIRFIKEKGLISGGDKILAAFSGGPDSVCLLSFLIKFRKKYKIEIAAFHLDHKLRRTSSKDEKFCKDFCDKKGIKYFSLSADIRSEAKKSGVSVEEAGRNIRYKLLEEISRKENFTKIAMGHNRSDNTETVLLNLIKGTGLKGISGIPARREKIIRPLLVLTKDEILDYLKKNRISYITDKTNLKNDYERNFLRNRIIPLIRSRLNPNIHEAVFRSSENFKNITAVIEKDIEIKSGGIVKNLRDGVCLDIAELKKLQPELIPDFIKSVLERNFMIQPSFKDIMSVNSLILKETGKTIIPSGGLRITRERASIIIKTKNEPLFEECMVTIGGHCNTGEKTLFIEEWKKKPVFNSRNDIEYINGDRLGTEFLVREWKSGDKFSPIGMKGRVKVSDFLNSLKIPSSEKKRKLLLIHGSEIIWVIGYRISEKYKIQKDTRRILKLCLK